MLWLKRGRKKLFKYTVSLMDLRLINKTARAYLYNSPKSNMKNRCNYNGHASSAIDSYIINYFTMPYKRG